MTKEIYKKGTYLGSIDRTFENDCHCAVIVVTLPDGSVHNIRTLQMSDEWLIKRATQLNNKKK